MKQFFSHIKNRTAIAVMIVAFVGVGFAPAAHASTNSDLEAQIQQLLALVAQLQAELGQGGGTSGVGCSFTRDLGFGMSGSDVACLQNYLITSGYSIPAGPTGSFFSQTQTAVAIWQAAHGISPANGYFSATSRSEYQTLVSGNNDNNGNGGNGNGNGNNGDLRGGQASIEDYSLVNGDETLREGENNRTVATIRFRPNGGDVQVNTIALQFQANDTNSNESVSPWDYFDSITIFDTDNDEKLDTEDVSRSSAWDKVSSGNQPTYEIDFKRLNDIIREDDTAHLEILISADSSISNNDVDQTFDMFVPNKGLEAEDSTGRTRTTGDDSDTTRIQFEN